MLQVSPKAEAEVIQASFRVLARLYHPDVSRDPESAQRMRELNAAYDVLRDPIRRAEYDAERAWAAEARRAQSLAHTAPVGPAVSMARAGSPSGTLALRATGPTLRGRLVLVVLALLGALTLLLWLLLEMLNEGSAVLI